MENIHVNVRFLDFDQLSENTWHVEWREYERHRGALIKTRGKASTFLIWSWRCKWYIRGRKSL